MKTNKGNFDKKTFIDSHGRQDIIWWKNNILGSFDTIRIGNHSYTIIFQNTSTGGQFSITETLMYINVLELKAIFLGLRSLYDNTCNSHIKMLSDNTTAVHCINNMESCRSVESYQVTKSTWGWVYIPGGLNREADEES